MTTDKSLSIVISAYNEEGNIKALYRELKAVLKTLPIQKYEIIFVDDGSKDKTLYYCHELQQRDSTVKIVHLVRNFGHEMAMTAGMDYASGDAVIFMDADLQHPPKYIKQMVDLWLKGNDIVLTRRQDNLDTSKFYKFCSKYFYKILNLLSDTYIPQSTPDFRLIDRKYIDFLKKFNERDTLFRGTLSWIVPMDKMVTIDFVAPERLSGQSKYNYYKSLKLAFNSILQFSVKPLYLSLWLAVLSGFFAVSLGLYVIIEHYVLKNPTPGYATIMATIVFMGSITLFILAIMGAYIAKIHIETKKRPLYLAEYMEESHARRASALAVSTPKKNLREKGGKVGKTSHKGGKNAEKNN